MPVWDSKIRSALAEQNQDLHWQVQDLINSSIKIYLTLAEILSTLRDLLNAGSSLDHKVDNTDRKINPYAPSNPLPEVFSKDFNLPLTPSTIMGDIRKDYVSEHFMIVSKKTDKIDPKKSPFAPGNESMTNPSVLSLVAKDGMLQRLQDSEDEYVKGWSIRVFESKNPVMSVETENSYSERPFYSEPAYGYHYVVVATPNQKDTLATIDAEQWSNVLVVVQDRLRWLYTQKGVTYVSIYADHGDLAGGVSTHPHLNMLTLSTIPPLIEREADAYHKILNEKGVCPMCQTINEEISGPRQVLQTEGFIAFCPWAPSYPYEFWISPKKHTTSFSKITQKEINDLSLILRATLGGLSAVVKNVSYNLVFHLSPEKKNSRQIHWHIEIYPITKQWSGLERGYGIYLNDISPEQASEKLGAASRKQFANLVDVV